MTIRICLWSGPRNISTAMMYAFAQRDDCTVVDEPLYAHYLSKTNAHTYHPGAEEVLATMENDGQRVVDEIIFGEYPTPIVFFKHMTHHLVELDWSFMERTVNVLLTRDPRDMLPSYAKQVAQPVIGDTGYDMHLDVLNHLKKLGQEPPVLESNQVLKNPRSVLSQLCTQIGIPFTEAMLSWKAGARPEDGSWAKYWYHSLHKSTGFRPYSPKSEPFPLHLEPLLAECRPLYQELAALAIRPEA